MEAQQLVGAESERRVRLTGVVAELNFVYAGGEALNDGADLSSQQPFFWDIFEQGNYSEHLDFSHRATSPQ
jgi:hypothetical protein